MFTGKQEKKELEEKLQLLQEENQQLRRKLRLLTGNQPGGTLSMNSLSGYLSNQRTSMAASIGSGQKSISGLDIAYLVVDKEHRITQLNTKMAEFLATDKSIVSRKPKIEDYDYLDWAPQVFTTLLKDALEAGDNVPSEFEASRINVNTGEEEHFHFKALWSGGLGTLTLEDITKLKKTREFFERLVSPSIVTRLLDTGEDPFIVEKRSLTVLFGDLRSFTKFCELTPPEKVQQVFNEFFHLCMEAIERNEATLDKFVGDQVMAIFSAPIDHPGHAYQAVRMAVDLQSAMSSVRQSWIERELLAPSLLNEYPHMLKLGVGINTGDMLVGLFGDERSSQYTVLGHHVNLAARFCSNASGGEVLAGMPTLEQVKAFYAQNPESFDVAIKFRSKGEINVKGITNPISIATLVYEGQEA